jgi:hypothetical protein
MSPAAEVNTARMMQFYLPRMGKKKYISITFSAKTSLYYDSKAHKRR